MNDGVFLNPDSGDIIATGTVSASEFTIADKRDIMVGPVPFTNLISDDISAIAGNYSSQTERHLISAAQVQDGGILVLRTRDPNLETISVSLSSIGKNYDNEISSLSTSIEVIGSDYLDSNDKLDILNRCVERDEIKLYYGPQTKQLSLSIDTGNGHPYVQTVTMSCFYSTNETSSSQQLSQMFERQQTQIITWTKIQEI